MQADEKLFDNNQFSDLPLIIVGYFAIEQSVLNKLQQAIIFSWSVPETGHKSI